MSATGRSGVRRKGDFYPTPAWVTELIVPQIPAGVRVLDAGSGDGAISDVMSNHDIDVVCVEIDEDLARLCALKHQTFTGDFLSNRWHCHAIVMNPPFSLAEEFVRHSLDLVGKTGTVIALLRLGFLESKKRSSFHRQFPSDIYVLDKRPSFVGGGTDQCAYCWAVWGPGRGGRWTVLSQGLSESSSIGSSIA